MRAPDNKTDMYDRLSAGEFGNHLRHWKSVAAAKADGYRGLLGMRTSLKNGPWRLENMTFDEAVQLERDLRAQGAYFVAFMEEVPNEDRLFNGELRYGPGFAELKYGEGAKHMREHMASPLYVYGHTRVYQKLRDVCGADEALWLQLLCERYDGQDASCSATVEFSVFSRPCGTMGWRTLIWEVRSY